MTEIKIGLFKPVFIKSHIWCHDFTSCSAYPLNIGVHGLLQCLFHLIYWQFYMLFDFCKECAIL